ncbi:DUF4158 domain-containing protein [Streptomyces sp. NPDC056257]|uniref:DUF4158 domain-containing protein n=1 Tax=Streptomyces sp. NPDC056257 TaxID=3345765 RepID=UPI0035DC58E4
MANKSGATRLGFSLLLKFFELEARFPDVLEEVPPAAVEYVADLVKVPATDFAKVRAGRSDCRVQPQADPRDPGIPAVDGREREGAGRVAGRGGLSGRVSGGPAARGTAG